MKSMALEFAIFVLLLYHLFMLFCYLDDHTKRCGTRGTGDLCDQEKRNVCVCGIRTFRKPGHVLENNNKMNPYKTGQGRVLDLFCSG